MLSRFLTISPSYSTEAASPDVTLWLIKPKNQSPEEYHLLGYDAV
jgi:hypothetical protein